MKKLTEITMQFIFPEESWYLCIPAVLNEAFTPLFTLLC